MGWFSSAVSAVKKVFQRSTTPQTQSNAPKITGAGFAGNAAPASPSNTPTSSRGLTPSTSSAPSNTAEKPNITWHNSSSSSSSRSSTPSSSSSTPSSNYAAPPESTTSESPVQQSLTGLTGRTQEEREALGAAITSGEAHSFESNIPGAKSLLKNGARNLANLNLNEKTLKNALKNLKVVKLKNGQYSITVNGKTEQIAKGLFEKILSPKTLFAAGGALVAAASTMFFGQWGQAEAPEPIQYTMTKYILPEAEQTGNWDLYDEAAAARDEIINLSMWQELAMWTPFSPAIGITNKLKGIAKGAVFMDKYAEDQRVKAEQGLTEADMWRVNLEQKQAQLEQNNIDFQIRIQTNLDNARIADREDRAEAAAFWANEAEKQRKLEEEDRQAIKDFWEQYAKEKAKLADESRPSKLNFGIV